MEMSMFPESSATLPPSVCKNNPPLIPFVSKVKKIDKADGPKFEGLFGKKFKPIKTPMSEGYHSEVDDSPLCTEDDSAKYRSIIGCCISIWIIVLGRFDIAYATSTMSRFNMLPREGHLKAVK
jgi:hypothetical protein